MNSTAEYELTVVIPVYNEEENLPDLFASLERYRRHASLKTCFIFVNDASRDRSFEFIKDWCMHNTDYFYLSLARHSGITGAIKVGVFCSNSRLTGYLDADLQADPEDLELLIKHEHEAALMCGQRDLDNREQLQGWSLRLISSLRRSVTGDEFIDSGCPLKVGRTDLLRSLPWYTGMHSYLPSLVKMTGNKVITEKIKYRPRLHGSPRGGTLKAAFAGLCDLLVFLWMRSRYVDPAVSDNNLSSTFIAPSRPQL